MMQQIISIVKVVGPESEAVLDELTDCYSLPDFDPKQFQAHLKSRIGPPSFLSYWEYYDSWSMGDLFDQFAMPELLNHIEVGSMQIRPYRITCKSLPWLKKQLKQREVQFKEHRWLYERALESIETFHLVSDSGVLVIFRDVIGMSFDDSEVRRQNNALSD